MRILLAEDEKDMADVLIAIMKHQGFDVDWAENGAVAVDLASRTNYDCMVFDIMMPVKDGITALKEVRAAGDVTPARSCGRCCCLRRCPASWRASPFRWWR